MLPFRRTYVSVSWAAAACLAALCGVAPASPAQAAPINLVLNGDFTQTTRSGTGGYVCNQASGTACGSTVSSWSATCGPGGCSGGNTPTSVLFSGSNGSAWNGGLGLYSMSDSPLGGNVLGDDGDSNYSSSISQTINGLTPGHTYSLTFEQAAAQQKGLTGDTKEQWKVSLGGSVQTSALMNNASHGFVAWNQQALTYTATLASEVLTFLSLGSPAGEPPISLLANVSLVDTTPVPEPAALSLLGMGLLGALAARHRMSRA